MFNAYVIPAPLALGKFQPESILFTIRCQLPTVWPHSYGNGRNSQSNVKKYTNDWTEA